MRNTMQMPKPLYRGLAAALVVGLVSLSTSWAAPPMPSHMDADYEASGFVVPAGMPPIGRSGPMMPTGIQQAGFQSPGSMPPPVMGAAPAASPMMEGGCMDCGGFGCNRCTGGHVGSGLLGKRRGLLHRMASRQGPLGGAGGCASCDGLAGGSGLGGGCGGLGCGGFDFSRVCLFCRGSGCSLCQSIGQGYVLGCLSKLLPYSEAGLCAQRWYDVSMETMLLSRSGGVGTQVLSRLNGPAGPVQLTSDGAGLDDSERGFRISGSLIFGAGGNLELTYLGVDEWDGGATVLAPGTLQSFTSDFGTAPPGGFANVDNADSHSVSANATFHSGEFNYRRRTVGPYCRFQGSWLAGLRYLRVDDGFQFAANTNPVVAPDFLILDTTTKNELFGPQIGGDLWWNVIPGINFGVEVKGGVMNNDIRRFASARSAILNPARTAASTTSEATTMAEMTVALVYRLSHSLSLRTSYYVLGVDEIAGGFEPAAANTLLQTPQQPDQNAFTFDSLTIQGYTFGTEYIW